ncbi:MAG: flagellar biosynthesis protein FlhB [Thiohalomonadaceae bacterium]
MAESESGQDKSEQATPKREREAREKGQIARSKELATAAALIAAASLFIVMGEVFVRSLAELVRRNFMIPREFVFDEGAMTVQLTQTVNDGLFVMLPLFILMVVVAVLANIMLGGFSFSTKALAFKGEKLDPIKGLGRVFAWRGLMEMFKGLAKFVLVGTVGLLMLNFYSDGLMQMGREALPMALGHAGEILVWSFLVISSALLVVVAIDVPFQVWDHQRQMKMTKQEVKDEYKQTEGSPEVKGRQRRLQMEMAQRRMMEQVPSADVVVTNPTHYAVALRYDASKMNAPVVVAKGVDLVASRIRAVAVEHDVTVLSAPPLARAIYYSTELDEAIPDGLYRAVAQILAYVYQLKQGPIYGKDGLKPVDLDELPIPDELRRDE